MPREKRHNLKKAMEISRGNWRAPRLSGKIYTQRQYDYLTRHILFHENSTLLSTEGRRIAYARACVPHVRLISRGYGFCKHSSWKSATLEQLTLESEIKTPVTFKERLFEWNQLCRKGDSLFAGRVAYTNSNSVFLLEFVHWANSSASSVWREHFE